MEDTKYEKINQLTGLVTKFSSFYKLCGQACVKKQALIDNVINFVDLKIITHFISK